MALGSGIFASKKPALPHLVRGQGGIAGEIADLRQDIVSEFAPLAAIAVEEFTNLSAAGAALISAIAQSQVAAGRSATLLALAAAISPPRNITVTVGAGGTPADAPATSVVTGTDINGDAQSETLTVPQEAGAAATVKTFASVTSIVEAAGQGTGAAISYGTGTVVGLGAKAKTRAGLLALVKENAAGSLAPTPGAFVIAATSPPNGSYAPNTAANGTNDYALYYEQDLSTNEDA